MKTYYKIKAENHSALKLENLKFASESEVCEFIKNNQIRIFNVYKVTEYLPQKESSAIILPLSPEKVEVTNEIREMLSSSCSPSDYSESSDDQSMGLNILSFLLPLVGIILYFCNNSKYPKKAKGCLVYAAGGFITSFILGFLYALVS